MPRITRQLVALLLWLPAPATVGAQAAPPRDTSAADPRSAQPERPSVATHAGTVARGYVEFEGGLEVDRNPGSASNHITTLVTKIGLASHLQLSFFTNGSTPDGGRTGFGDAAIGMKWRVADDHPLLGDFAILPALKFPTGSTSRGTGTGSTDASLLLISSRDVGPIHADVNVGYTWRNDDTFAAREQWLWTFSLSGPLVGPFGWNGEWYGYPAVAGSDATSGLLVAATWQVDKTTVLDVGFIAPVTNAQPHALFVGVTKNAGRLFP